VESITEGCHSVQGVTMSKASYAQLEVELYQHAYKAGLAALPYPPRFLGTCAAVRPGGLVVLPNGDLHKCWDTVSSPHLKVGTIFDVEKVAENELARAWHTWTPFQNQTCRNCKILPNCAGACAYKFIHAESTRGEAAVLPCPSWKYNIKERLLNRALATGLVKESEIEPSDRRTDPTELCSDNILTGGLPLPVPMQAFYKTQNQTLLRILPQ
jgi:uncharacterized protein